MNKELKDRLAEDDEKEDNKEQDSHLQGMEEIKAKLEDHGAAKEKQTLQQRLEKLYSKAIQSKIAGVLAEKIAVVA